MMARCDVRAVIRITLVSHQGKGHIRDEARQKKGNGTDWVELNIPVNNPITLC